MGKPAAYMPGSSMPKGKRAAATQEAEDASTLDTVAAGGPSQPPAEEKPAKKAKKARKPERSGADQPYENGVLRELVRPSRYRMAFTWRGYARARAHTRRECERAAYVSTLTALCAHPCSLAPTPRTCRFWRTS